MKKRVTFTTEEKDEIIKITYPKMREKLIRNILKIRVAWDEHRFLRPRLLTPEVSDRIRPRDLHYSEILRCGTFDEAKKIAAQERRVHGVFMQWNLLRSVNDMIKNDFK